MNSLYSPSTSQSVLLSLVTSSALSASLGVTAVSGQAAVGGQCPCDRVGLPQDEADVKARSCHMIFPGEQATDGRCVPCLHCTHLDTVWPPRAISQFSGDSPWDNVPTDPTHEPICTAHGRNQCLRSDVSIKQLCLPPLPPGGLSFPVEYPRFKYCNWRSITLSIVTECPCHPRRGSLEASRRPFCRGGSPVYPGVSSWLQWPASFSSPL